MIGGGARGQ